MPKLTKKERDLYEPLDESAATIERGRKASIRVGTAAEQELKVIDRFILGGGVASVIRSTNYKYSKTFLKQFKSIFKRMDKDVTPVGDEMDLSLQNEAIRANTIQANKFGLATPDIDKTIEGLRLTKLSTRLHKTNRRIRNLYAKGLKKGMKNGNGAVELAKQLKDISSLKRVSIPKHIQEITNALRRASQVQDSIRRAEQIREVKRVLKKHKPYIDSLTRAGEDGFQQLGIGRATKKFAKQADALTRDIAKLNESNINRLVDTWAGKKGIYHHTVVTRTETVRSYSDYNRSIWADTDGVIGLALVLSDSHPVFDICDELAGFYPDISTAPRLPHHPNCICREEQIYADDDLSELGLPEDQLARIESINKERGAR